MSIISPLVHSEKKEDVKESLVHLEKLLSLCKEICDIEVTDYIENNIGYAKDHLQLLEKFARYPHRNKVLNRINTAEEEQYMKELEEK